jgi:hypothetical protein
VILATFNAQRFRRLKEEEREFINKANFEHAVEISRERAAMEEADLLLMVVERQKLVELNAQISRPRRPPTSKRGSPRTRRLISGRRLGG